MVKIRLARMGKKNDPFYRVVAIDSKYKVRGEALQVLGHWHPRTGDKVIDKKTIASWVGKGAQVSPAVTKLMEK